MATMTAEEIRALQKGDILIYTNEKSGTTSTWVVDYPQSVNNAKHKLTVSETPPIDDPSGQIQPKPARRVAVPTIAGGGSCEGRDGCVRVSTEVPNGRGKKRFSLLIKDFTNWSKQVPGGAGGTGGTGGTGRMAAPSMRSAPKMARTTITATETPNTETVTNPAVTLTELLPTVGQVDVETNSTIILTFSDKVKAGSGNIIISNTSSDDIQTISVTSSNVVFNNNKIIVTPLQELKSKITYQVTIDSSAVKDTNNNIIDVFGENIYQFTVK